MDKEYIVLNEISKNPEITQRELSKLIRCSVGTINILLNKMVNKGLIKIKRMPMNRIIYMLTPMGIVEKIQKTSSYIKSNYNYMIETQEKLRTELEKLVDKNGVIYVIVEEDEISKLVRLSIKENNKIKFITDKESCDNSKLVVVLSIDNYNKFKEKYGKIVNILELI
ncbi:winged helix-turn-helix transcriptional regulator [Ruminiclostridium herbifermentans]|uniref:Winged helix-turn-helix transcriptional regulator n=1 Tax=Ruminiclostridium herbifermentans TaxID=2488810 RepID=A0A4U7JA04_9FIRM|nr:winged helix-turn-helix transcriptional regulator [Ruminiclostridium herbifermentans]QNU66808.1 winged helix-turn-helix transcriptional regulator [Ruminiclostridium herbifermentans]